MHKLSFCIITSGKRDEVLQVVLSSITSQKIPDYEIIVSGVYRPDRRVVFVPAVEAARKGKLSILRNLGIAKATGDLIIILDDDVILSPTWYQNVTSYDKPFDILTSQVRLPDGTRYWDHVTTGGPRGHIMLDDDEPDDYCYMSGGCAWIMRREVAESVKWGEQLGFYESEDSDFAARCLQRGFSITHNKNMLVYHADPTYTSIGRKVLRRKYYPSVEIIRDEVAAMSEWDVVFFMKNKTENGLEADAADVIRYGCRQHPDSSVLREAHSWLINSLCGGNLSDNNKWYPDGDPTYLEICQQYKRTTNEAKQIYTINENINKYIIKREGRYIYLSDEIIPHDAVPEEVRRVFSIFNNMPPFYFHFGGAGDALMLLATFNPDSPGTSVVCCANSIKQMESFFEAFPNIESVYFLPHPNSVSSIPEEIRGNIHLLLRYLISKNPRCIGRGTTPLDDYNNEWNQHLDCANFYNISLRPDWLFRFKSDKIVPLYQVVLAPKGSNAFGYRSKRNTMNPRFWRPLLSYLQAEGITPVVIGTPDEEAAYPLDSSCIDRRSFSFKQQMNIIASSDLLIGADSWHKSFSGLAGVPAIVFQALTGPDLAGLWKDSSEYVFIDPWDNICLISTFEEFQKTFTEIRDKGRFVIRRINPPGELSTLTSLSPRFWQTDYSKVKSVLFRSSSAIGDALNLTAVTAEMKRQYPHINLYVSGSSIVEDIFRHNSHISGFVKIHSNEELFVEGISDVTIEYNHILDRLVEYKNGCSFMDIYGNIAGIRLSNYDVFYTIEMEEALWALQELKSFTDSNMKIGLQFHSNKDVKRSYPNGVSVVSEIKQRFPDALFVLLGLEPLNETLSYIYDCARQEIPLRKQMALAAQCDAFVTIDSAFFHVGHNLCNKPTLLIAGPTNPNLIGSANSGFLPIRNTKLDCLDCYWTRPCAIECMCNLSASAIADSFGLLVANPDVARHAWRRPLETKDMVIKGADFENMIIQLLETQTKPIQLQLHDPFSMLPPFADNWNGISVVRPETGLCLLPENYEHIDCPFCHSNVPSRVRFCADIVKCNNCDAVYLRTRLKKEAMEQLYQSYEDGESHLKIPETDELINTSGLRRDYFLKEILNFISAHGVLLDVGCGWGAFLDNARFKGFTPRGIELTKKGVNFANKYLGINVTSNQFVDTPFDSDSLAVVTMLHVLEHLPEPSIALHKIFDILEPGGMFCGIVPNFASFCSNTDGEKWYWLDPDYHYVHYTSETLRHHLESTGFVIERFYTVCGDYGTTPIRTIAEKNGITFVSDTAFNDWLKEIEAEGKGEEIRFFARKPFHENTDHSYADLSKHQGTYNSCSNQSKTSPTNIVTKNLNNNKEELQERALKLNSSPVLLEICTTTICNINPPCVQCWKHVDPNLGYLNKDAKHMSREVLRELAPYISLAQKVSLHGIGEPLACPYLFEEFHENNNSRVGFVSNGLLLNESAIRKVIECGISFIDFSLDAVTPEIYRKIRHNDFSVINYNLLKLQEAKRNYGVSHPEIFLNMCLMRENISDIPNMIRYAKDIGAVHVHLFHMNKGADYKFDWFDYREQDCEKDPVTHDYYMEEGYRIASELGVNIVLSGRRHLLEMETVPVYYNREINSEQFFCNKPWTSLLIQTDGSLYNCCWQQEPIGTLQNNTLMGIWNGDILQEIRESTRNGIPHCICKNPTNICPFLGRI